MGKKKFHNAPKKQNLRLPHRGSYLLGIYTVLMPLDVSETDWPAGRSVGKLWVVAEEDFTRLLHGVCVASLGVIIVINWRPQIGTCHGGLPSASARSR